MVRGLFLPRGSTPLARFLLFVFVRVGANAGVQSVRVYVWVGFSFRASFSVPVVDGGPCVCGRLEWMDQDHRGMEGGEGRRTVGSHPQAEDVEGGVGVGSD